MRSNKEIYDNANALFAGVMEKADAIQSKTVDLLKDIKTCNIESGLEKVGTVISCIDSEVRSLSAGGTTFPGFLTRFSTRCADSVESIELKISSKLKAERKFKGEAVINVDSDFVKNVVNFYTGVLFDAYYIEEAAENIEALNVTLKEVYEANDTIKKQVYFTVGAGDVRVVEITDKKVVLNADTSMALNVSKMGIMAEGDEYAEFIHDEAVNNFVATMQTVETTPEILKKRINVVDELLNLRTKKHANKIIREGYHKQAVYLKNSSSGVGYFNGKVDDKNVFALLEMNDEGEYKVVLSPFNSDTLEPVDVDIVSIVKKSK